MPIEGEIKRGKIYTPEGLWRVLKPSIKTRMAKVFAIRAAQRARKVEEPSQIAKETIKGIPGASNRIRSVITKGTKKMGRGFVGLFIRALKQQETELKKRYR